MNMFKASSNVPVFIIRAIGASGFLILNMILAKEYGNEYLGSFSTFISILAILAATSRFGLDNTYIRFGSIYYLHGDKNSIVKAYLFSSLFIFFSSMILSLCWFIFSNREFSYFFLYLMLLFNAVVFFNGSVLKSLLRPAWAPFFEPGFAAFSVSVLIILSLVLDIGGDVYSLYLGVLIFSYILSCIAILSVALKNIVKKDNNSSHFFSMRNYTQPMYAFAWLSVSGFIIQWAGVPLVDTLASSEQAGVYSLAFRATLGVSFVLVVITSIVQPKFSQLYFRGELVALKKIVKTSTRWGMLSGVVIAFLSLLFFPMVYSYLGIGSDTLNLCLFILIIGQLINVITGPVGTLLNMTGYHAYMARMSVVTLLVLFALSYFLIPLWGAIGGAISNGIALSVQNIFAYVKVRRVFDDA